jgi:hypothetical protein
MTFEIERKHVGPGWQRLIENLHAEITKIAPSYDVIQIKEKFGGLRYYISLLDDVSDDQRRAVYALIEVAETQSNQICEECGEPGENRSISGWWKTFCTKHRDEATIRWTSETALTEEQGEYLQKTLDDQK